MRAAVLYGPRDLRVEERRRPAIGADDVLVRVAYCGICGSDLHTYEGMQTSAHRRPPGPRILGHELSGVVEEAGAAATAWRSGERVTCIPWATCGACAYCRRGLVNHCERKTLIGGAMAEYVVAPQAALYRVPSDVPLERAALAEPLSCAVWAMDLAQLPSGSTVAIIGAGTIGLLLLLLSRAGGAARVVVSEPNPERRRLAAELGATLAVDPREQDVRRAVADVTDGLGADAAFEAVGGPATAASAIDAVRNAGTVVLVGVADATATLPVAPFEIYKRELTIRGCFTRRNSFPRAIAWLSVLNLDPLLGRVFPLSEVNDAIAWAKAGHGAKVLVRP